MSDFKSASSEIPKPDLSAKSSELTLKRGVLALILMYASQLLAGIIISHTFKLFDSTGGFDIQIIGLTSILLSGIMVLLWFWWDIRRSGSSFHSQIGLQPSIIKNSKAVLLIISMLGITHFLAWIYRSVLLPMVDQGGIIGGGSQMFTYIQGTESVTGMIGFLTLALIIGPVMEEIVFRGYLQSSLAKRIPAWAAIGITSLIFMAGHSPMVLWPMYFMFSITWGWIYLRTKSLKMAILFHMLSNLFYTVIGFAGWDILA